MTSDNLAAAPVLSTPAEHILTDPTPALSLPRANTTEAELHDVYEIGRTAREIKDGQWSRIALQFPDHMLPDAPKVVAALDKRLCSIKTTVSHASPLKDTSKAQTPPEPPQPEQTRLYILGDTSYSACCVDEVAAEHVNADVVVHYGRACLSPTARLPVIHVFTTNKLDLSLAVATFCEAIPGKQNKVIVMADVTFQTQVSTLCNELLSPRHGYKTVLRTTVVHNPKGKLPNRRIQNSSPKDSDKEVEDVSDTLDLKDYDVFHIGVPPTALLLALSSRVKGFHVMATPEDAPSSEPSPTAQRTRALLGRRYARVLTLASAGIIGVLVNTLSIANYVQTLDKIKERITAAGKKSYTVVVGKLNPAKLANFAEIDGWVVVGCWESGLVEGEGFYRPVITPFELGVALTGEGERVWGGEWWGGIEGVEDWRTDQAEGEGRGKGKDVEGAEDTATAVGVELEVEQEIDEEESEAPEFDLRTGKLVSRSRPMRSAVSSTPAVQGTGGTEGVGGGEGTTQNKLVLRAKAGEVATIKGTVSPGAEFLRTQRTWTGLGSDYIEGEESAVVEQGRSGVARGYAVGEDTEIR